MDDHKNLDMTSDPNEFDVPVGAPVFAVDGESLGTVSETREGHFKVEDGGDTYWLSKATIFHAADTRIDLQFTEAQLEVAKLDEPRAQADSPIVDAGLNVFSSAEAEAESRQRMERGYGVDAEQAAEGASFSPTGATNRLNGSPNDTPAGDSGRHRSWSAAPTEITPAHHDEESIATKLKSPWAMAAGGFVALMALFVMIRRARGSGSDEGEKKVEKKDDKKHRHEVRKHGHWAAPTPAMVIAVRPGRLHRHHQVARH